MCKLCDYSLTEFHRDTEKDAEVSDFRKFSGNVIYNHGI